MQKTAYEKYYRFFSGFLLVVCLLKPVIDFAGTEPVFPCIFFAGRMEEVNETTDEILKEFSDMQDVLKKNMRQLTKIR